jgi:hypothetical protein
MLAHEGAHCLSAWLVDGRHTAVVFRGWKFVTVLGDVTSFSVSQRAAVYSSGPAADLVALSVTLMLSSLTQMNLFMPFAAIFALLLSNLMPVWSSDGQQIWRLLRPGIFVSVNDETE